MTQDKGDTAPADDKILWRPSPERVARRYWPSLRTAMVPTRGSRL